MTETEFLGLPVQGNWTALGLYLTLYVLNVVAEEVWWRGYILPRQETVHGRATWLVHGLLWNLFHFFFFWDMPALVPSCFLLSYVAQRSGSTWPGIFGHATLNAAGVYRLTRLILGT